MPKSSLSICERDHDPSRANRSVPYRGLDDAVLGVVILDLVDRDYSWAVLTQSDQAAGYTTADMGQSPLPTEDDATAALHDAMRSISGKS